MPKGIFKVPVPINEPIKSYTPGSPERKELQAMLKDLRSKKINHVQIVSANPKGLRTFRRHSPTPAQTLE